MAKANDKNLYKQISDYWDRRAESLSITRREMLNGQDFDFWRNEFQENFPKDRQLKILDLGTSTGFIAIIAASLGHSLVGIDISDKMLHEAEKTASAYEFAENISFQKVNAEQLPYESGSFDVVISRYTICNTVDPAQVYAEAHRVLKPGGLLLIYDSDFGHTNSAERGMSPELKAMTKEFDALKDKLMISDVSRPDWDLSVLRNTGFIHCECRRNISNKLGPRGYQTHTRQGLFAIYAVKQTNWNFDTPSSEAVEEFRRHVQVFMRENRLFGHKKEMEFHVLSLIARQPEGARPSDILEYYYIPKQTLTYIIAHLTEKGLITQEKNPRDARSMLLKLTAAGENIFRAENENLMRLSENAMKNFPLSKMKKLNQLYTEYINALLNSDENDSLL